MLQLLWGCLSTLAAPGILFPWPWQKHKVGWKFHPFKTALGGKYSVLVGPLVKLPKLPLKFIPSEAKDGPHSLRDFQS